MPALFKVLKYTLRHRVQRVQRLGHGGPGCGKKQKTTGFCAGAWKKIKGDIPPSSGHSGKCWEHYGLEIEGMEQTWPIQVTKKCYNNFTRIIFISNFFKISNSLLNKIKPKWIFMLYFKSNFMSSLKMKWVEKINPGFSLVRLVWVWTRVFVWYSHELC